MTIIEALIAEHVVFHNLFDHVERVVPGLKTLAGVQTLAGALVSTLKAIAILLGLVIVAGMLHGRTWHVERSTLVDARPAAILPLLTDFEAGWRRFAPWAESDATATWEVGGVPGKPGHVVRWRGAATRRCCWASSAPTRRRWKCTI